MATALVTGATAGIGAAYSELLAKAGFDLVLVARDLPRLNSYATQLKKSYKIKIETI
ncbi:MAG: SDR family NAD(P)-dependent oxidoreductase, partial [bacterium]